MKNHFDPDSLGDPELQSLLVACLEKIERGEALDRETLLQEHPKFAQPLAEFLDNQEMLREFASGIRDGFESPPRPAAAGLEMTMDSGASSREFSVGEEIRYIGEYEVLSEIARGGMGIVFKARQQNLNRVIALKMILAGRLADAAEVERFQREARAAGRLKHPNIVPVHEIGEHEGRHYFTMDYIDGRSLSDMIRESALAPRRAAKIVCVVAEAVHFAHQKGTLHRDLKPANILLGEDDTPHITDFGLAKVLDAIDDDSRSELTATGQILGTPSYMSPEQAEAKPSLVGLASDIYSLGAILYACLTGRAPFVADSPVDTLLQVLRNDPVSPRILNPMVPRDLETICLKCLSKEPHKRYGTAQQLADDLKRYLNDQPVLARPIGRIAKTSRWARRNPWIASLATISVLLLVSGTAISSYFAIEAHNRADAETVARTEAEQARMDAEHARDATAEAQTQTEAALTDEEAARRLAEHATKQAQWQTYVARLQPIRQAWLEQQYGHLDRLLTQASPQANEPDFRGWEWDFFAAVVQMISPRVGEKQKFDGRFVYDRPSDRIFAWSGGELTIWDLKSKAAVDTLRANPRQETLSVSPAGNRIAVGNWFGTAFIFDLEKTTHRETPIKVFKALQFPDPVNEHYVAGTRWAEAGSTLAVAIRGGEVSTWDTDDWSLERVLQKSEYDNTMGDLDWHPKSGLATGHRGHFNIWDIESGERLLTHKWRDKADERDRIVQSVRWSPEGDKLALANDGLRIWDNESKTLGDLIPVGSAPAVVWLDEHRVACGGDDQAIILCNADSGTIERKLRVHSGAVHSLAVRDEHTILSGAANDGIRMTRTDIANPGVASVQAHDGAAMEVEWSPDGTQLLTCGKDGKAIVWDSQTLKQTMTLVPDDANDLPIVWDADWNTTGDQIATIDDVGTLRLWDVQTGSVQRQRKLDRLQEPRLEWRPSQRYIVIGNADPQLVDDSTLAPVWKAGESPVNWRIEMQISPDGLRAVGTSTYGNVLIISLDPPAITHRFEMGDPGVGAATWSPDGKRFIVAGADLSIYDADSCTRVARLEGHRGPVGGVGYQPNGTRIASAGRDGFVHVWDAASGDLLVRIPILDQTPLIAIAWSPDGRRIATVNENGVLVVLGSATFKRDKSPEVATDFELAPKEQLAKLTLAIGRHPQNNVLIHKRAIWHSKHAQWREALVDLEKCLELAPDNNWQRSEAARAALMAGDIESYHRHLNINLEKRLPDYDFSQGASAAGYLARTATLVSDAIDDLKLLWPLAFAFSEDNLDNGYIANIPIAMVMLRLGDYKTVLQCTDERILPPTEQVDRVLFRALRALALEQLGTHNDAVAEIESRKQIGVGNLAAGRCR